MNVQNKHLYEIVKNIKNKGKFQRTNEASFE